MNTNLGIIGQSQAAIDLIKKLSKHDQFEIHIVGDQSMLNQFQNAPNIQIHRTPKQVLQHSENMIHMVTDEPPLLQSPASHGLQLINITGCNLETIEEILNKPEPTVLFAHSIGLHVNHAHTLLTPGKHTPKPMCELAEKIMRGCGSIQWINQATSLHTLTSAGASIPMLSLVLLESINLHLLDQKIDKKDANLFIKNLFLECAKFIQTQECPAELFSASSEYLYAKPLYLRIAKHLCDQQFDKILAQSLSIGNHQLKKPPALDHHERT